MYGLNGSSDSISRDMNSLLYSTPFKHPAEGEFAKIKQLISLDPYPDYGNQNQVERDDEICNENPSSLMRYRSTPSSFFSNLLTDSNSTTDEFSDPVSGSLNHEPEERFFMTQQQQKDCESDTPHDVREHELSSGSYGYNLDSKNSDLVRQNSTPPGFLSSLTGENGFASMKKGSSSSSTLNNHISFSLGSSTSSSRFLPQIAENENELQESQFGNMKRSRDGALKMSQNGETGGNSPNLVHHMSLPKTSSEMAAVDNFLHFQQESTVPWKTRAKRGFATHPRSIAERERRTRISERIKRLQELFPDIDKQTNTSDMLDMAVEYIKNLQQELENLNEARARCRCSTEQLQSGSTI